MNDKVHRPYANKTIVPILTEIGNQ